MPKHLTNNPAAPLKKHGLSQS